MTEERFDVVVVGAGSAAFEAAVAARDGGADRVLMLEKAPEAEYGGNARFSGTGFRFSHAGASEIRAFAPDLSDTEFRRFVIPPYSQDDFRDDLDRVTDGRMDPEMAAFLVSHSNEAVHWMRERGIRWELVTEHSRRGGERHFERGVAIHVAGGGLGQLSQWREIAQKAGIEIRFDSPVVKILGDLSRVSGVRVARPEGGYDVSARAVIACSGGFQANPAMRAAFLRGDTDRMKVRGTKHDTGEVTRLLLELGARPSGEWTSGHMSPIDAAAPPFETPQHADGRGNTQSRYDYPFGITVNAHGARFFDEGEAQHSYTYAKTGRAVLSQPQGVAYQIFDRKGLELFRYPHHAATFHEARSITELARAAGLDEKALVATVADFNAAVQDAAPFDPSRLDGRGTKGLAVPKSNWAVALDEPPFRAYPVTGGITFTFGGVQVDRHARVIGVADKPIEGLYASGDILGLFFGNYPSFTGQTRNAVFSRAAALHLTGRRVRA